ncbi:succinate--CoA ligase subunit alpha [Bifidobacterium sp. ESL0775]|uniref:succinate--CoA ligase subunit alpha n=1 Tax=Bifidobacterium sp. ESL0775 TaxID=2983230 RepID=UPI0023F7E842|nr:succinate--CoA ligase subunit alpha [Bifidobacterium sp. ESL0775]WEV68562.1 succinate--CoA ligase subunit alpha [Bifidobacterium sp. ESL0775]
MALFIEDNAPVIVQGMTGHQGMTHTGRMLNADTNIVGGVNPRKAGQKVAFHIDETGKDLDIPVYATCMEAKEATGARASVIFVPPRFAKSAMLEAIEAGIELIVVITEGIPVADTAYCVELALQKGIRIIGPNCPGLLKLPESKDTSDKGINLGIIPDGIVSSGPLGLVSKSGTLTYQLMGELSDIGFTACLGVGGDPIVGTTLVEALQQFEADDNTKAIMMIGEIGGNAEQDAAAWAKAHMSKPVVAYIAGFTAPEGKQMGHAGAIVSGGKGTAQDKKEALEAAGIPVGKTPGQAAQLLREIVNGGTTQA